MAGVFGENEKARRACNTRRLVQINQDMEELRSGVFITFPGNCRKALTFYQTCFGGTLQFDMFDRAVSGNAEIPIVSASLIAPHLVIYGSDLVHDEGRKVGNYVSVLLPCQSVAIRKELVKKLSRSDRSILGNRDQDKLVEVIDSFDVRWILTL